MGVCVYINIFGSIYLQPNNQSDPLFRCIRAPICHHRKTAAQSCVHCNAVPSRCVEKKLYSLRAQPWTHCADMCRCSQEMSRYLNRQGVRSKQTSLAKDCQYIVYTLIFGMLLSLFVACQQKCQFHLDFAYDVIAYSNTHALYIYIHMRTYVHIYMQIHWHWHKYPNVDAYILHN